MPSWNTPHPSPSVTPSPTRGEGRSARDTPQLPKTQNIAIYPAMEELFGDPAYKGFVLQDRKRLPSRFSSRVSGALTSRLR
ncbi:hypothetical protein [Mesorhizobium sp. ES1-4]|uniref:hypothetical protein n=1 Tax=Mesorhizobium sp. ES1-4 TaxID=2876627 RepID=UPI001CCBBFAA|nr:hypothetical protein [Mesorhizobium sp. ES1-4]MBZ9797037.1 hypothetical protein [Mesorhizobium sp. ES1-4]